MRSVNSKDFPLLATIRMFGSVAFRKSVLKVFSPEKTDSTINRDNDPTTTPILAILVIILMALLLLLENK